MAKHKTHHYASSQESYQEEIGSYMSTPVISVEAATSIQEAVEMMDTKNIGSILVKEGEEYVGIVTERDITRQVIAKNMDAKATAVSVIMSSPLHSLEGSQPITEANQFMAENKIRHMAVTENGKVVGMLSVKDLVSFFANPRLRR